jgi:hypothetical protein
VLTTLTELEATVRGREIPVGEDVVITPKEWAGLVQWIAPYNVIAATADEPPMFWFLGRRVRQRGGT